MIAEDGGLGFFFLFWCCFCIARFSASLIFLSSELSSAKLSDSYSLTVAQPAGDLSAILISLFRYSMSFIICLPNAEDLFLDPTSTSSSNSSISSLMSQLNSNCFLLDLNLNSDSFLFLFSPIFISLCKDLNFTSKYSLISFLFISAHVQ